MIAIVEEEINADQIERAALEALQGGAGAVVRFIGTVRNNSQGHDIAYLEYEAYAPMAEEQMRRIAVETQERWGCSCAMAHRLGRLQIGEAAVAVAVAAPHRREAFEACAYAMDRIKSMVPIWKKEVARDGFWWVEDPVSAAPPAPPMPSAQETTPDS